MADRDLPDMSDLPDGAELDELRALAASLGSTPVTWEDPPADLWDRIAAEAGVGADHDGHAVGAGGVTPITASRRDGPARDVRRRRAATPWLLAAAAAVTALVAGAVLWMGDTPDPTVVASVSLDRLGATGEGVAELVDDDGTMRLRLETDDLDAGEGFVEVWVIDPEVSQLVSLGPLRADGVYDLPDGLDPEAFPIVDVSYEPLDGDPTHSGDSVLRGQLEF